MNLPNQNLRSVGSKYDLVVLWFAIVFPSVMTYVYFSLLADSAAALQQMSFGVGKVLQFGLPVVWVWLFYRHRLRLMRGTDDDSVEPRSKPSLGLGVGFGLLVVVGMMGLFYWVIADSAAGVRLSGMVKEKIDSMGLASVGVYVAMGVFYTIFHSVSYTHLTLPTICSV